jgi:hypothetical protein
MREVRIGIAPKGTRRQRGRLFDALEELLSVKFVDGCADVEACVAFGVEPPGGSLPALALLGEEATTAGERVGVSLVSAGVDSRLRGRTLEEAHAGRARLPAAAGAPLARDAAGALWARRGSGEVAILAPLELGPEEPLRDRLHPGRWLALAPLIQFVRTVAAAHDAAWSPPPPRATFLLDDPNLHWPSYGFLRFARIAAAAREQIYHVAFATIPIDAWFAHPKAARTFRENPGQLSLLMHGNDHLARELARELGERERQRLVAQALRRIVAFERRSGVPVSRLMAAPHGVCSEEMARTMLAFDLEGVTISRPYPWLARPPAHWLAHPPGSGPVVGMRPAEIVVGGLPVLLRTTLQHGEDDLMLRAFLDQPLIVSGHHDDLAAGLDPLAEIAASINRIGDVHWGSLRDIARTNFASRVEGGTIRVRPYTRSLSVELLPGTEAISVEAPDGAGDDRLLVDGVEVPFSTPIAIGGLRAEARIVRREAIDPGAVGVRRGSPWPVARRVVAESRDRLLPLLGAR